MTNRTILVTGGAGFIGSTLVKNLLLTCGEDLTVVSVDNISDFFENPLKYARLQEIRAIEKESDQHVNYIFHMHDISNKKAVMQLFQTYHPDIVIHLAAHAGVTDSIHHPDDYVSSNLNGFYNILEACRTYPVKKFLYASSSSVYGDHIGKCDDCITEGDPLTNHPLSLYAATKKCNETLAYTYSHLYGIPSIGMRFFTVYGESGRPDMFCYKIAEQMLSGKQIRLSKVNGKWCERNFTHVEDVVKAIRYLIDDDESYEKGYYEIVNICNDNHPSVYEVASIMMKYLKDTGMVDQHTELDYVEQPLEEGNTHSVFGSSHKLRDLTGFTPCIDIDAGIARFVQWFKIWKTDEEACRNKLAALLTGLPQK
jgi:UDP-glucuronate 4-epimerase